MTSPPERQFSQYINSYCLAAETRTTMKNKLLGKKFLNCSFYLYRFHKYVSYGFPIINFCNPGVHYEMPCILLTHSLSFCKNIPPNHQYPPPRLQNEFKCMISDHTKQWSHFTTEQNGPSCTTFISCDTKLH